MVLFYHTTHFSNINNFYPQTPFHNLKTPTNSHCYSHNHWTPIPTTKHPYSKPPTTILPIKLLWNTKKILNKINPHTPFHLQPQAKSQNSSLNSNRNSHQPWRLESTSTPNANQGHQCDPPPMSDRDPSLSSPIFSQTGPNSREQVGSWCSKCRIHCKMYSPLDWRFYMELPLI